MVDSYFVPAGEFMMGNPLEEPGRCEEENQNQATILDSQDATDTTAMDSIHGFQPEPFLSTNRLVERVSWDDAQALITKVNKKQNLPLNWKFALPTEAQRQSVCRAGEKGS